MAEAAPSNSSQPSSKQQQSRKHRRRQSRQKASNNKDDGSDSDSEHQNDGSDKNPGQSRRRPIQNQEEEAKETDDTSSAALLKEESDRVRLLQTLARVGSDWERMRSLRQHSQESGAQRMEQLIGRYGNDTDGGAVTEKTLRMMGILAELDKEKKRRQEYLDDALCVHLEGKSPTTDDDASRETPDHWEKLVQRAEQGIIRRCRPVDIYASSWNLTPPKPQFRLVRIVKSLYSSTWNYLSSRPRNLSRSFQDDIAASRGFIEEKCRKSDILQTGTMIVDPIIDSYFTAIAEELSEDVVLDMREGQRRPDLDTLRVCEKIHNSRHNDHLTPEYSTWASSRLDPAQRDAIFLEWNRNKQQEILTTFRKDMHSAKVSVRQEFCWDGVTPGVVSLVLFKNDWPSAVKDVAPEDLQNMGWVLEHYKNSNHFVRRQVHRGAREGREHIFQISMDDEVLAMLALDGKRWIYWDEKDFPEERNQQHRLPFI